MKRALRRQHGLTLLEIMIALAIMGIMMTLAWLTIRNTSNAKRIGERVEQRNLELRVAMGRMVNDLEHAYLSKNEDTQATQRRTLFIGRSGSAVPEIRFSALNHRPLTADANESEQTVISYEAMDSREERGKTDLLRREQRRVSNDSPDQVAAEYDVLVHDIKSLKLEFWDWKREEWKDRWDSTSSDGERNRLPTRVRITLIVPSPRGDDYKLTTEARLLMQEALSSIPQ